MPNVPTVRRELAIDGALLPSTARGFDGSSIALEQFAVAARRTEDSLQQAGSALARQKRAEAQAAASRSLAEARLYWLEEGQKRKEGAPLGAPDFAASFLKDYRADAEKRLEAIDDDDTRELVRERLASLEVTLAGDAHGFEYDSRIAHRKEHLAAGRDAARKSLFLQPSMFDDVVAERDAILERSDLPATVKAALRREEMGELALSAAQGLLEKDPQGLLDATSGKRGLSGVLAHIDPDHLATLTNRAQAELKRRADEARQVAEAGRTRRERVRGTEMGDAIFAAGGTYEEMAARAREIPDVALREVAAAQVKERVQEQKLIAAERTQRAQSTAWQAVESGKSVNEIPDDVAASLPPGEIGKLQERQRQVARGVEPVTDDALYNRLYQLPTKDLAKQDLMIYRAQLDDGDFQRLQEKQRQARDAMESAAAVKPGDPGTLDQQIRNAQAEHLDPKDIKANAAMDRAARAAAKAEISRLGRALTYEEQQKIIDRQLLQVTITRPGKFYNSNSNKKLYEVGLGERPFLDDEDIQEGLPRIAHVTGVPESEIPKVVADMRAAKMPVTLDNIEKVYADALATRSRPADELGP